MVSLVALLIIPTALLLETTRRRQASRARLVKEIFEAVTGSDIRILKRVLSRRGAKAVADTALDARGCTAYDVAVELRLKDAADLLGKSKASLFEKRKSGADLRVWQCDRVIDTERRKLSTRMRWSGIRLPAVSVLVIAGDDTLYERVDGYTNMAKGVVANCDTRFMICSITKQFVAAAILRLQDEGLITVRKDKLARWYPDFKNADQITLEHLMTHTSGLRDYLGEPGRGTNHDRKTEEEMVAIMKRMGNMFHPGERMNYSNTNYCLLGLIVQRVSGKSLSIYLQDTFFRPLRMSRTGMHTGDPDEFPEDHTVDGMVGYMPALLPVARSLMRGTPYAPHIGKMPMSIGPGCGGDGAIYSTARDLVRWNKALYEEKIVISEKALKQMLTRFRMTDGTTTSAYGYGLCLNRPLEDFDIVSYGHCGGALGFSTLLEYIPARKMSIVVLTNTSGGLRNGHAIGNAMHTIWTHDMRKARREIPAANDTVTKEELAKFVGTFDFSEYGEIELVHISQDKEGQLSMKGWGRSSLIPVTANLVVSPKCDPVMKFMLLDETSDPNAYCMVVERDSPGRKILFARKQGAKDRINKYAKQPLSEAGRDMLVRCCGRYDFGIPHVVVRRDRLRRSRLVAQVPNLIRVSLVHMEGSKFCFQFDGPLNIVEFVFDENAEGERGNKPTHLLWRYPTEFPVHINRLADS